MREESSSKEAACDKEDRRRLSGFLIATDGFLMKKITGDLSDLITGR